MFLHGAGLVFGIQALEAGAAQQGFHLRMAQRRFQRPHVGFVQAVLLGKGGRVAIDEHHRWRQGTLADPGKQRIAARARVQAADDHRHPVVGALAGDVEVGGVGDPARVEIHELEQGDGALCADGIVVQYQDARLTHDPSPSGLPGSA
ncbi:hypothetical protein D3C71_1580090 [compost metagenome]